MFKKGDKVVVLDSCIDTRKSGWPVGESGIIESNDGRPLVRFPGSKEGHMGDKKDASNKEHWFINAEHLAPLRVTREPMVDQLLNDYRLDMANTDT